MDCELRQATPTTPATIIVTENGKELYRQDLTMHGQEDAIEFNGRIWRRVWALRDQYQQRAARAMEQEFQRLVGQ